MFKTSQAVVSLNGGDRLISDPWVPSESFLFRFLHKWFTNYQSCWRNLYNVLQKTSSFLQHTWIWPIPELLSAKHIPDGWSGEKEARSMHQIFLEEIKYMCKALVSESRVQLWVSLPREMLKEGTRVKVCVEARTGILTEFRKRFMNAWSMEALLLKIWTFMKTPQHVISRCFLETCLKNLLPAPDGSSG